jgi:FAD/FMN-containing dehydrogenase
VLPLVKKVGDLARRAGGKVVLSGWIDFNAQQWKEHFGEQWSRLRQWKQFFDPQAVLNPGFIDHSTN